ncbi:MAG: ABC transporter permease subunit [Clostridia bacterium]|nr:ABC transporter permease subunit [Clostridia bacterium]
MKLIKPICRVLLIAAFWVAVWWIAAAAFGKPLLFPSPPAVFRALLELLKTADFYKITAISLWNVLSGILIAVICAVVLSAATAHIPPIRALLLPAMTVIKATPVASFIILAWILMGATQVPTFITILIVLPVMWSNLDTGFQKIDTQLAEVTTVYGFSVWKRIRLLLFPSLKPYFIAAFRTSVGLAWKAGIAAEIITMPRNTVGTMISEAKLYILTAEMFAWTLVVILLSLVIEALFSTLFKRLDRSGVTEQEVDA